MFDQDHKAFTYATVELLATRFDHVHPVTSPESIATEEPLVNRQGILRGMAAKRIFVHTFREPIFADDIFEGVLPLRHVLGREDARIESVSLLTHATARIPNDQLVAPLRAAGVAVEVIGDCHAPRSLLIAASEGYRAGMRG